LIESQEAERQRIAAELHDSLGQHLLVIRNRATLGERAVQDPVQSRNQFDEISASATQAISEVRTISHNLRPVNLDRLGLAATIEEMVERVAGSSGIQFSADIEALENGLLTKEQEVNCFRIIQESLNNIIKHAQATKAYVELWREDGALLVTVRDNGRGFAAEAAGQGAARGMGLTSIAERVRILGGAHTIKSALGEGTTLDLRIPLAAGKAEKNES
jgi:signal transduction histidine kinase